MKKREHGFKNWLEAMKRDCSPGHTPHNPRVIYNPNRGFSVKSNLAGLGDGDVIALGHYEPYGTSVREYLRAVKNIADYEEV